MIGRLKNLLKYAQIFILLSPMVCCCPLFSDDTGVHGIAGKLQPFKNHQIQMKEEVVNILLTPKKASVNCTFIFQNQGPRTTLKMGFPKAAHESPLFDFLCFVNGKPVKVNSQKVKIKPQTEAESAYPYREWKTWMVTFEEGKTKTVKHSYWVHTTEVSTGDRFFTYILKTGANWKGNIEKGDITITFKDIKPGYFFSIKPPNYKRGKNQIRWSFVNFKPTQDVEVHWKKPVVWFRVDVGGPVLSLPAEDCLRKNQIYVPVRWIAGAIKAEFSWDKQTRQCVVGTDGVKAIFIHKSSKAIVNNQEMEMGNTCRLIKGKIMIPIRFFAKIFNLNLKNTPLGKGDHYLQIITKYYYQR